MGKNKNKESVKDGFYYRFRFTEQIKELDTIPQAGELLDAAEAYVRGEDFVITDKVVKMAFVSWKTQFDWDLKKSEEYHKERKEISEHANEVKKANAEKRRKREAELKQQQQPELFKEEAASEEEDVPLVEAEEVEPYPFEAFWREYISHKDEKNARIIWKHLSNDLRKKAINGARIYTQYVLARKSKDPKFDAILKSSTFLKDAHWNDEYKEEELTPQNYGNNRSYQSDYERRKQQQNAVLTDFMAEAAARVQAIEDAKNRVENI